MTYPDAFILIQLTYGMALVRGLDVEFRWLSVFIRTLHIYVCFIGFVRDPKRNSAPQLRLVIEVGPLSIGDGVNLSLAPSVYISKVLCVYDPAGVATLIVRPDDALHLS